MEVVGKLEKIICYGLYSNELQLHVVETLIVIF